MDTQAVNSAGNPTVPPPKTQSSSSGSGSEAVPTPKPKVSGDSVELSSKAQSLLKSKTGGQASSNSEKRKFSVTENNDVVVQVIDSKTQEVVKSIPTEEQIDLKNAVRDGINDITE
jgi:hypothetical protein